jgi:predicted flap endonuclease-1-like 5' DNA nuclease
MTSGADLLEQIDGCQLAPSRLSQALSRITGSPRRPSPRTRYNLACHLATIDPVRCLEILGDDSRRDPHPWASEDPVLAELRTGPRAPTMRAVLRRGRAADPPGTLSRLDTIGTAGVEQLNRAGIYTPADLLGAAGPKDSRTRLAKRLTREDAQLKEWANLAELALAIDADAARRQSEPGGPPQPRADERPAALDVVNLLAIAGIGSCGALGSTAQAAVKPLADRLTRLNRAQGVIPGSRRAPHRHSITQAALNGWIAAAKANGSSRVEPPDEPAPGVKPALETATEPMPPRGAEAGESE